jgi:hypothetical protein
MRTLWGMFRTALLLSVFAAACGDDPAPPDGATHAATWECISDVCESPIADRDFAAVATVDQGESNVMALAWTSDGAEWISHAGRTEDGCWRFDAGEDLGVAREAFSVCRGDDGDLVTVMRWGTSEWSVVLSPIAR